MKNKMKLYFFYVVMNADGMEKKYTMISPNPDYFKHQQKESSSFIPVSFNLYRQSEHIIDNTKDNQLFDLTQHYFSSHPVLRYEDFVAFDDSIDNRSFRKDLLLNNKSYVPENEFEQFLDQHHILHAYYLKNIQFIVKAVRTEYSRSHGTRDFDNQYTTDRIDMTIVTGNNEIHRSTHIYSSTSTQKLISFNGKNDKGHRINVSHQLPLTSSSKKM